MLRVACPGDESMVEELQGFEKKAVWLQDGREIIYYTFKTSKQATGGEGEELKTGKGECGEEAGRV